MKLEDLEAELEREIADIDKTARRLVIGTARSVFLKVLPATPVDTSKAVSNWVVGVGSPVTAEREAFFLGSYGSTANLSLQEAAREGLTALNRADGSKPIYISNNADYILDINYSSSRPGFIEAGMAAGMFFLDGAK